MAFAKKTWKDRIAEFPTRRRLTKEDNTSELVTVAREEGTLSQEGDAFSAENMNDLENRIDAEFTAVNGKLDNKNNFIIKSSENEKLNADVVIIKHNKMIQIRFDGFKNLTLNTYNTLFVLPDEFKPVGGLFYACSDPNGDTYRITISSNGVVELFPYTNINLYNTCNTFVYISN